MFFWNKIREVKLDTIILGLYFILAPFEQTLNFGYGTILVYLGVSFILLRVLSFSIRKTKSSLQDPVFKSLFVLTIIVVSSMAWSINIENSKTLNKTILYLMVLFLFVYSKRYNNSEIQFIDNSIILGGLILSLFIFFVSPDFLYQSSSERAALGSTDPNEFAALLLLPFFVSFKFGVEKKKYYFLGFSLVILYLILITGSRGALLALTTSIIYYYFTHFKVKNVFLVVVLIIVVLLIITPLLPEYISMRLWGKGAYTHDIGVRNTRFDIWTVIFTKVFTNFSIIGHGTGSGGFLLSQYMNQITGVHNTYFSMIVDYGVLGLPVFLYFLFILFKKIRNESNGAKILSFIAIVIVVFFLDSFFKKFFWNILMYCAIIGVTTENSKLKIVSIKKV